MFQLSGISRQFTSAGRTTVALRQLDLTIGAGTTVLIGPSGCGKSTLLRLMAGLIRPDTGQVLFEHAPITADNVLALRRRMGYVIQDGGLFPHLSARENVALVPRFLKWDQPRLDRRIAELTALTRLPADLLRLLPHQLSGGQRQRVSLMRALALDPDVLLLDEPLGALDPMVRRELQDDLRGIIRGLGKTAVLVTHDIREASFFADTVVMLREGQIVQQGTWRQLLDTPAEPFVTQFINAQRSPAVEEAPTRTTDIAQGVA